MKKIIILLMLLVLFNSYGFPEEEELGKVDLTVRQMGRLSSLHSDTVKGFTESNRIFTVTATRHLSKQERRDLTDSMKALSDDLLPDESDFKDFKTNPLKGLSPQQAEDWAQGQDPKEAIKKMARALALLLRRTGLNQ